MLLEAKLSNLSHKGSALPSAFIIIFHVKMRQLESETFVVPGRNRDVEKVSVENGMHANYAIIAVTRLICFSNTVIFPFILFSLFVTSKDVPVM